MVNHSVATTLAQVLVVPPFECTWLTGENLLLRDGKGCISFEVKGDNDVTIILKPNYGSRRWQHLTSGRLSPVEANYTIILGSHRNSCLKIEKDGELCHMATNIPGSKLSSTCFSKYWVNYNEGSIIVGCGEPHLNNACCSWTDEQPIKDIRFVGLSAWDRHVGYRNIQVHSCLTGVTVIPMYQSVYINNNTIPNHHHYSPSMLLSPSPSPDASPSSITSLDIDSNNNSNSIMMDNNRICDTQAIPQSIPSPNIITTTTTDTTTMYSNNNSNNNNNTIIIPSLVQLSCQTLLHIIHTKPECLCSILSTADTLSPVIDTLRNHAIDAVAHQFTTILKEDVDGFRGLSVMSLRDIFKHQSLVCGEKILFDALMQWSSNSSNDNSGGSGNNSTVMMMDEDKNSIVDSDDAMNYNNNNNTTITSSSSLLYCIDDIESILPHIRFPLMSLQELHAITQHPFYNHSTVLQSLIKEALDVINNANQSSISITASAPSVRADRLLRELTPLEAEASTRLQRRCPPGCIQLIYMYDGDHNGVCWYLGTRYGTQQWVNPVVAGYVDVKASSPISRGTDPRGLLSRAFLRNNFAGPKINTATGEMKSWWSIDLGEGHALECNYYTLRHDASSNYLRSWLLQGSNDAVVWVDLRRHENEMTLKLPGQYASWPVSAAAGAYRYFRVMLVAPNSEAPNPYHVCLSNVELYGNFYRNGESPLPVR